MNEAKNEILSRISRANVVPSTAERAAVTPSLRPRKDVVEQFAEYVDEYKANVIRCRESDISAAIQSALEAKGSERAIAPADLPEGWAPGAVSDSGQDHQALADMQAVVTACALGIAETGTIVLDAGLGQGRRALTLIPDHHICVIREDQIVDSVPEAVAALADAAKEGRPMTWISGPSATSDIELSRVEGVHGPRMLDVIIVGNEV